MRHPEAVKRSLATLAPLLPTISALVCIGLYASQLFLGRWQNDEYKLFHAERLWGWNALLPRLSYSPRPVSETLLFIYGKAVLALHRPLITSFLGLLWATLLVIAIVAARSALPASRMRGPTAAALVLSIFAFMLTTSEVTEAFFWPMAAAAYLPTCMSATMLFFALSAPPSRTMRLSCAVLLIIAAGSSEVGAAFTLGFALAASVEAATRISRPGLQDDIWWILPGILGLAVFVMLVTVRVPLNELNAAAQPATGHIGIALDLAARQLAIDLIADPGAEGVWSMTGAFAGKLLFAAAFAALFRQAGGAVPGRRHLALAVSLLIAAFFSLFAAYLHYGTACCERQATTRHWLLEILLIITALAVICRVTVPTRFMTGPAIWLVSMILTISLLPVVTHIAGMREDFAVHGLALEARSRTWKSGLSAGTSGMKFYLPPDGGRMLVRGTNQPLGTFRADSEAPEIAAAAAMFFGKSIVTICEPWQTEKSLLLDGHFIPACPPHGGPPDIVGSYAR